MYNIQGSYERPRVKNTIKRLKKPRERFTNTTTNPSKKPSKKPTNLPTVKPITFGDTKKIAEKSPYAIFGGKDKYCSQRNEFLSHSIKLMQDVEKNEIAMGFIWTPQHAKTSYDNFLKKMEEHRKKMNYHEEIRMSMPGFDGQKLGKCTQKKLQESDKIGNRLGKLINEIFKKEEVCKKAKGPKSPYHSCIDKKSKEEEAEEQKKQKMMMIGGGILLVLIVYFLFLRKK